MVWALQHCCFSRVTHTTTGCLKCRCSGHLTWLLFFIERVKAGLLSRAGLVTKSFYMDAVMEARFSPFGLVAATMRVPSTATWG